MWAVTAVLGCLDLTTWMRKLGSMVQYPLKWSDHTTTPPRIGAEAMPLKSLAPYIENKVGLVHSIVL